ncbi:MAG: hypothetical protein IJ891_03210 [Prevotella sp.]|nr:hypothetical protein [Prevotella sp.]
MVFFGHSFFFLESVFFSLNFAAVSYFYALTREKEVENSKKNNSINHQTMKDLFTFVSLIEKPKGEKNQNKGNDGTKNAKCKILVRSINPDDLYVATVCSNREAMRTCKRLKPRSILRVVMGNEGEEISFLAKTPLIHVSSIELINFYATD